MLDKMTNRLDFHGSALLLRSERQRAIASNIANADTPGYVARDFKFADAMRAEAYTDALMALAQVRASVDAFFEDVMVNVDEPQIRANRLGLLKALFDQLNAVADISKLGV